MSITTNAEGKITKWSDTDGGSVYASQYKPYGRTDLIALATMKEVQTSAGGSVKTVVDFGEYFREVGAAWPGWQGKDSAAMIWGVTPRIREAHIVRSDTGWDAGGSGYCYPVMFGFSAVGAATLSDSYPFMRLNQELFQNGTYDGKLFNKGLADGEIFIDGVARKYTYKPATKQFYIASFVPSNALENVNMFAGSVQGQIGGQQIGESVVFTRTNTVARRTAIMRHLARKWTQPDAEGAAWNMTFDSLSATGGGTLTLRTNAESEKIATESLTFGFAADGSCAKVVVDGAFELPATGALTVSVPEGFKPRGQRYELLSADSFAGAANLSGWTVVLPENCRGRYEVRADASGLSLERVNNGLLLLVR